MDVFCGDSVISCAGPTYVFNQASVCFICSPYSEKLGYSKPFGGYVNRFEDVGAEKGSIGARFFVQNDEVVILCVRLVFVCVGAFATIGRNYCV